MKKYYSVKSYLNGNIAEIRDTENNHTVEYVYDDMNRLIKVTDGDITEYTYDINNNRSEKRIVDINGNLKEKTVYSYNKNNQLIESILYI
jgi:YD repeat-containing protein